MVRDKEKKRFLSSRLSCVISVQLIRDFCDSWCCSLLFILAPYIFAPKGGVNIFFFIFALAFLADTTINVKRCENEMLGLKKGKPMKRISEH